MAPPELFRILFIYVISHLFQYSAILFFLLIIIDLNNLLFLIFFKFLLNLFIPVIKLYY